MDIYTRRVLRHQPNFWNNIHFHPTDAIEDEWGQKILNDVAADGVARTVRMYAMLEDIVTRDTDGNLHYDFTLNDLRMDYMLSKGFNLLLSYNFIPPFLARNQELVSAVAKNKTRYKGKMIVTSPPSDYTIWEEICYQYTMHILERYGKDTVKNWYLQCLNEPDLRHFWMSDLDGSVENEYIRLQEYCKLYTAFESGIRRACEGLKLGGPALASNLLFYGGFLQFVKETNKQMDFVCVHSYGTGPNQLNNNSRPFCVENNLRKIRMCRDMMRVFFPTDVEYIVDEWGAASAGFYNIEECPKLIFRETEGFAAYFGKLVTQMIEQDITVDKLIICLSGQHEMITDFSGFRNFFTLNHIKKPIYNAYVLMGRLGSALLAAKTVGNTTLLATKEGEKLSLLLTYAAENFDRELPDTTETLTLHGITETRTVTVHRIDRDHTNPYGAYLTQGMTDPLTQEQIEHLRRVGTLSPAETYTVLPDASGTVELSIPLSTNALVLIEL